MGKPESQLPEYRRSRIGDGLAVDPARMRANLDATGGLELAESVAMALAVPLGTSDAHACVEAACRRALDEGRSLGEVVADDLQVPEHPARSETARRLSPENYLGAARVFIDRVLDRRTAAAG